MTQSPDQTTAAAARLGRIAALEAQRMAALIQGARAAEQATVVRLVRRQYADALAFARRGAP